MVGVAEAGVAVDAHLAVDRDDRAVLGLGQRVDLDQGGVLLLVDLPQLHEHGRQLVPVRRVEAGRVDDLASLGLVDPDLGVDGHLGQRVGPLDGQLLDVHAALLAAHGQVGAVGPVEQQREVVLLGDLGSGRDHHLPDGVALDVHAEDALGRFGCFAGRPHDLDAAGLASAPGLDLRLDDDHAAASGPDRLGRSADLLRGVGHHPGQHGHPVRLEHVSRLVLEQIHGASILVVEGSEPGGQEGCVGL